MRKLVIVGSLALIGAAPPPSTDAKLRDIVAPVSQAQLRHTIEKLVSFGTRHTLSSQTDPKRGIGAALEWARGEFQRDSAACGNCLTIVDPSETFTGARIPTPTKVRDMVAIQRGTERPNDVVIITGHIDRENDAPSRNISRYLDSLAAPLKIGLDVRQVWRNDRFGRGGDHTEFLNLGFPAVRFSVAVENYDWQHQDVRVENGKHYGDTVDHMDFPYLAKVAKLNVAALAAIASAPPPPEPKVEGAVSTDTAVSWPASPGDYGYKVWWRRT